MPRTRPISVNLIVKNCAHDLATCLDTVRRFMLADDELVILDTGSTDGGKTVRIAKKFGARVIERPDLTVPGMVEIAERYLSRETVDQILGTAQLGNGFLSDFAAARQIVADASTHDLIFWVDSDDVIAEPEKLRALATDYFEDDTHTALFVPYLYAFDEDGACTTSLVRERICDRRYYQWRGVCHETLIPKTGLPGRIDCIRESGVAIEHRNHRPTVQSDIRNYAILRNALENARKSEDWIDPRWFFYLGNACRGMKNFDEATEWYTHVLRTSGSRDDRFTSCMNIATIFQIKGRPWRAIDWHHQAAKIDPRDPRAWFGIARCYFELKKYNECLLYTDFGLSFPRPDTVTAVDPNAFDFYPILFSVYSCMELGAWDQAITACDRLVELRPDYAAVHELRRACKARKNNAALEAVVRNALRLAHSTSGANAMISGIKPEIRRHLPVLQREEAGPPRENTVTYLCSATVEPWDGTSSTDGIGGSEKMVILLTRALAARGLNVEVYGKPKEENRFKTINGVTWKPREAFNHDQEFDTLVLWRNHGFLDTPIKANRIFVDLHDVQDPSYYTKARLARVDGYLFKSNFHAEPVRDLIPADKLIITRNALQAEVFAGEAPERDPHKIVFCSSADRGLLGTLKLWERIHAGNPRASLHVFYGFTPLYDSVAASREYQHFWDCGCDRSMQDYREECLTLADKLPRVHYHGRVSHDELTNHLRTAGIWLYPTGFPEISCMVAMEAQAAGALPVYFPTGALPETVFSGFACDSYDDAIAKIRHVWAKGPDLDSARVTASSEAIARYNLDDLADHWAALFSGNTSCTSEPSSPPAKTEPASTTPASELAGAAS